MVYEYLIYGLLSKTIIALMNCNVNWIFFPPLLFHAQSINSIVNDASQYFFFFYNPSVFNLKSMIHCIFFILVYWCSYKCYCCMHRWMPRKKKSKKNVPYNFAHQFSRHSRSVCVSDASQFETVKIGKEEVFGWMNIDWHWNYFLLLNVYIFSRLLWLVI